MSVGEPSCEKLLKDCFKAVRVADRHRDRPALVDGWRCFFVVYYRGTRTSKHSVEWYTWSGPKGLAVAQGVVRGASSGQCQVDFLQSTFKLADHLCFDYMKGDRIQLARQTCRFHSCLIFNPGLACYPHPPPLHIHSVFLTKLIYFINQ